jgi:hypothetical protein
MRLHETHEEDMLAMHAICHRKGSAPDNFRNINPAIGRYASGWWMLKDDQIESIVGGWIYFHEASGKLSHFIGRVEEVGQRQEDGSVELIVTKQRMSDQPWRGRRAGQAKTECFRLVPADFPHEKEA